MIAEIAIEYTKAAIAELEESARNHQTMAAYYYQRREDCRGDLFLDAYYANFSAEEAAHARRIITDTIPSLRMVLDYLRNGRARA